MFFIGLKNEKTLAIYIPKLILTVIKHQYFRTDRSERIQMGLKETIQEMHSLLDSITRSLMKAGKGNKAASQRVRTGTIRLEKVAKKFRKESVSAEKSGKFKKPKKMAAKKKRR